MTDCQINIAIAEACGWLDIHRGSRKGIRVANGKFFWATKDAPSINYEREYSHVPSYLNDLNAMHEAIACLNPEEADWFAVELSAIVLENPSKAWWDMNSNEVAHIANATARQRAEAFLRTLGKWEEVQP